VSKPLRLATIIGARPQFIKCAPFSRVWRAKNREILIHTGQHYSPDMSDVFFKELSIPKPDFHLGIGAGTHGDQTGRMLAAIEKILMKTRPEGVLVYGDTNSTLAGALAAAKLHIPLFHIEAGLRSFRKTMPEEVNRVLTDHLADMLFAPTETAVQNLKKEGLRAGVYRTGDIMLDAYRFYEKKASHLTFKNLPKQFALATIHRAENTDNSHILKALSEALNRFPIPVVWPIHPRTQKAVQKAKIRLGKNILILQPVGYLQSIRLQQLSEIILTDSGGVQKEAYFSRTPCITLRKETEWVESVKAGWNILAGCDPKRIFAAYHRHQNQKRRGSSLYGDAKTAVLIAKHIEKTLRSNRHSC